MKKKLLSLALALVLCLSLAVPAFAAEEGKADAAVSGEEKKEESKTPAEGEEKKDEEKAPAEGEEKKDEEKAPTEGEEKKDESKAPAEGEEKKDESKAPAEGEEKKDEEKEPAEAPAPKFTDVAADSPFALPIAWAVDQGITTGKTETTFGPSDTCTVSHILTFLWRANGKPGAAEGVKDRDAAAKWAVEQGLIKEGENLDAPCSRMLAVGFMWRVAGQPEAETEVKFTDVGKELNLSAIAWAVDRGVTAGTGDGTTFSPEKTCTRGQIVTFLYRAAAAAASGDAESGE